MATEPQAWVCPWGICTHEQAQECRADTRKGCGQTPTKIALQRTLTLQEQAQQLAGEWAEGVERRQLLDWAFRASSVLLQIADVGNFAQANAGVPTIPKGLKPTLKPEGFSHSFSGTAGVPGAGKTVDGGM